MKKATNLTSIVTAIAACAVFLIIYTDKINSTVILPILGALCFIYGIVGLVKAKRAECDSNSTQDSSITFPVIELLLGGFLVVIGLIELLKINLSQTFWNGAVVFIIIIALVWCFIRTRRR